MRALRLLLAWAIRLSVAWFLLVAQAIAGGPRYVTGPPFFTGPAGVPVGWRQTQLNYFTDPGDLSVYVNHAAADAMVAAAANVWNLPVANITIAQGGQLAEHVSGENTYLSSGGVVFPADVMSTNAAAVPIAVVYDTDGSITDLLLGSGASGTAECAQNGVTESVDSFDPAGYILHAIVVVNGRCTGSAPQAQLQLQYQLMRVFGRVLGLAWSQTNDNVFTGATTPTYAQELNWPIMHPIDILCGSYSYQCLVNPFTLRPDDIAAMVTVYPVTQAAGSKQVSLASATGMVGVISFPSGQGMAGANLLVKRQTYGGTTTDAAYEASAVSGTLFQRAGVSPFVAAGTNAAASMGTLDQNMEGWFALDYVPMLPGQTGETLLLTVEPVNPLYAGEHSVGLYAPGMVAMSGTPPAIAPIFGVDEGGLGFVTVPVPTAAATCGSGADGTLSEPMEIPATGWWNGLLCGYGHASFVGADVKPGRSFTVEVTALNEQGQPTTAKAMPVIGVYAPSDQPWNLPSVAVQASAFQGWTLGTTTLNVATGSMTSVRVGIADQRGDGRPDFTYQARMFYADSVTPATITTKGAAVTITGSGFRNGNAVAINHVPVAVQSWSASAIVIAAPAASAVGAASKTPVDVEVSDLGTGATTIMTGALTYDSDAGLPNAMRLVSVQTAPMYVGDTAATPFVVQVLAANGVTPVAGDTVVFSASAGAATFGCGAATCSVVSNAQGIAQTSVVPTAAGTVTITATDGALSQSGSFQALPQVGSIVILAEPTGALNVGVEAQTPIAVQVLDANGNPVGNAPVTFSVTQGAATFSKCANAVCVVTSDGGGGAGTWVTPGAIGPITIRASVGDVGANDTFTGASNVDTMQVTSTPGEPAYPYAPAGWFSVRLLTPQGYGDQNETVTFTAPPGVRFDACGTNTCMGTTDWTGSIGFSTTGLATGVYTLQAAFGAVTQTQVFTVAGHTLAFNVISTPGTNVPPLVASAAPFAVQLVEDGTTPVAGASVQIQGARGDVTLSACGQEYCTINTDANGIASTTVVPLRAGTIPLSAVFVPAAVTASFTVAGVPDQINVVAAPPPSGALMGAGQFLEVQLVGPDGVTGVPVANVTYTVTSGPFSFTSCVVATCVIRTDLNGFAAIAGTAWGVGPVTITVSYGQLTQVLQFNAVSLPDVLQVVSAPAPGAYVGQAAATSFAVQALFNGGVTPVSGRTVTVSVTNGAAALAACGGASSCTLTTDPNGMISTLVTPLAAGVITLQGNDGGVIASATFNAALRDLMSVISAPANGVTVGNPAGAFTVQVTTGDGITPAAGRSVSISVTNGQAQLAACAASSCTLITNAQGQVSTGVVALAAGVVGLTAVEVAGGATAVSAAFIAGAKPDVIVLASNPGASVYQGATTANPFAVLVTLADGVTPVAGVAVTFSVAAGSVGGVSFGACGAASCTVITGANGIASSAATGVAVGASGLTATAVAPTGTLAITAPFAVLENVYAAATQFVTVFVAEGATVSATLSLTATENGSDAIQQPVSWTSTPGISLAASQTITGGNGDTSVAATIGPLTGGAQASASGCAWASVCASFHAIGVAAANQQLAVVSGAQQTVNGTAYTPLGLQVVDGSGHPVAGASVSIYQTVTAVSGSCPAQGRCPAAPVVASNVVVMTSGSDGTVWVTPISAAGTTQTEIAASVGTQGFWTTVLSSQN